MASSFLLRFYSNDNNPEKKGRKKKKGVLFFQALLVLLNNNFPRGNDKHMKQLHYMRNSTQFGAPAFKFMTLDQCCHFQFAARANV